MNQNQGFTLIELLIVIAIIGILASVLIPGLLAAQQRAYDTGAQACARSISVVQRISQVDTAKYTTIGAATNQINRSTDGVDSACKMLDMYLKDRSPATGLDYTVDVWDKRGKKVFTVTPDGLQTNAVGATAFSSNGAGGSNLP